MTQDFTTTRISQLPDQTGGITGNELVPIDQNNKTVKTSVGSFAQGFTQGFITIGGSAPLPNARAIAAGSNITITDHGAGSDLVISATGELSGSVTTDDVTYTPEGLTRTLTQKLEDRISIKDFGAIGDGASHPLSSVYPTLAAAQVIYPHATSLTNEIDWCAIQGAINSGAFAIDFPAGTYLINQTVTLRSFLYMFGDGTGVYSNGTVIKRNADVIGFDATGVDSTSPFLLMSRVCASNMLFDGGNNFGAGPHYSNPMWHIFACYEFYFSNCRWHSCSGSWMSAHQFWDSRFDECVWTFGGSADGLTPALYFQSTYTVTDETCNNIYFYGNRFESCPGVIIHLDGNNGVDFFFVNTKLESVDQLDYLIKNTAGTGVYFTNCWLYAQGRGYGNLIWSGTTSSTNVGVGTYNFTVATGITQIYANMPLVMYSVNNPNDYMTGRVSSYDSGTGALVVATDYYQGNTGDAITNWTVSPMHPGLMYMTSARLVGGNIICGFGGQNVPVDSPYLKTFLHLNNTNVVDFRLDITAGGDHLPGNTFQAYHDTTTTASPGYGTYNFVIETGKTIPVNTMLYIFGAQYATHSDWMIGRVTAYNSGTGSITVSVDQISFGGVPSNHDTGWILTPITSEYALQTGDTLQSGANSKVKITGSQQPFGACIGTNMNNTPNEVESYRFQKYGSPTTYFRNLQTADDWIIGNIVSDPTVVDGTTCNTGQFFFSVFDYARLTQYTVWTVDGSRNLNIYRPTLMRDRIWWIDPDSGSGYREASIVGAGSTPPASGFHFRGSILLNSAVSTSGSPTGWVCTDSGTPGVWVQWGIANQINGAVTDGHVARFSGTAGRLQNSGVSIDGSSNVTGIVDLSWTGNTTISATNKVFAASFLTGSDLLAWQATGSAFSVQQGTNTISLDNTGRFNINAETKFSSNPLYGYIGKINSQSGTSYTLLSSDTGKIIEINNASPITLTLPNNFSVGYCTTISQTGSGAITFSPASGASVYNRSSFIKTAGQYAIMTLYVTANSSGTSATYLLGGDGST